MTPARLARAVLSLAAILIVGWSFYDVAARGLRQRRAEHDKPITLTLLHWGDQAEDGVVDDLVQKYLADHPKVRIVRINPGNSYDFENKLKTMLAAGTPPDLFYLPPDLLPDMASQKLIAPLDDRFAREPQAVRDDFFPVLLDAWHYDPAADRVGPGPGAHLYGIPKDFTTSCFYVNLDLFHRAGIPVPYAGWTWDEFEHDMRRITDLTGQPGLEGRKIYGGVIEIWPETLRNILWTFGGDFFGPGGFRDVALGTPAAQAALDVVRRTRLVDRTVYNPTGIAKEGAQEFFNGNIGCDGPVGRWKTSRFKDISRFRWDVVPVPHAAAHASELFYVAWTMSATTPHPDQCYDLMRYLTGREGQVRQSRLGLAIPCLKSVAYSPDFLAPPGLPAMHARVFLDAIAVARYGQTPREPEWSRIVGDDTDRAIKLGQVSDAAAAADVRHDWLAELDAPLRRQAWPTVRWGPIVVATVLIAITVIAAFVWVSRRQRLGPLDRAQERAGFAFVAPWVLGFLALTLGPMIASLLLSFTQWNGMVPLAAAKSVGGANYRQLFTADATFAQSLKVTVYYVVLAVPLGQAAALAVALLMNARARGIALWRTVYFVPSVVSGVALAVLWLQVFNNDFGLLNHLLRPVLNLVHLRPPNWFGGDTVSGTDDAARWAIPAFVLMSLWGVGGGMIIYLAGLKGIPASLYEAATIDGASPGRRFRSVTLPMLSPLIFYNLVMGLIGSFQVFTQAKVMTDGGPNNDTLFYVLNLYRQAFEFHNMGYASAMAWVLFVLVLALTLVVFRASRGLVYYEGLRS